MYLPLQTVGYYGIIGGIDGITNRMRDCQMDGVWYVSFAVHRISPTQALMGRILYAILYRMQMTWGSPKTLESLRMHLATHQSDHLQKACRPTKRADWPINLACETVRMNF